MRLFGQLRRALLERLTGDPAQGDTGRIWINTTTDRVKADDGTSIEQVMLEKHLPEARRNTKVQLDDTGTGNEISGVLPYTKGGTGETYKPMNVAAVDPVGTDDSGSGYGAGSKWFNTANDTLFVCEDASVGAAVWTGISGAGGGGGGGGTPVACTATLSTDITGVSGSNNTVVFNGFDFDTTGSLDTSTGIWTCPRSGKYLLSFGMRLQRLDTAANYAAQMLVNATTVIARSFSRFEVNTDIALTGGSRVVNLVEGDTVKLNAEGDPDFDIDTQTYMSIVEESTSTSGDIVAARYYRDTAQTMVVGSNNIINYNVASYDTHGAVSNGIFTAPRAAKYAIKANARMNDATWGNEDRIVFAIQVDRGSGFVTEFTKILRIAVGFTGDAGSVEASTDLDLVTGDKVQIMFNHNADVDTSLTPSSSNNTFSINEITAGGYNGVTETNISDWQSFTPNTSWDAALSNSVGKYRRVGSSMEIFIEADITSQLSSTIGNANFIVDIPSGFTIDQSAGTSKLVHHMGKGSINDVSSQTYPIDLVVNNPTSLVGREYYDTVASSANVINHRSANALNYTFTPAGGDSLLLTISIPVNEWTASGTAVTVVNDYGFKATRSSDQSVTITSLAEVLWDQEQYDRGSSFNTSTGRFQPDVAGLYRFNTNMMLDNIVSGGGDIRVSIYLNNVTELARGYLTQLPGTTTTFYGNLDVEVELNGTTDFVHVFVASGSDNNYDVNANPAFSFFTGHLISARSLTPFSDNPYVETTHGSNTRCLSARVVNLAGSPALSGTDPVGASWVDSIVDNGVGNTIVNIKAGVFSAAPTVVCMPTTPGNYICELQTTPTSTSFNVLTRNAGTGTLTDFTFEIIAIGVKP
jgi:hypothetical protein